MTLTESIEYKVCNTCHQNKPVDRFTPQTKNGVFAYYKGKCKDCYVDYRRKRKAIGCSDGVRKTKVEKYWKHIYWL